MLHGKAEFQGHPKRRRLKKGGRSALAWKLEWAAELGVREKKLNRGNMGV